MREKVDMIEEKVNDLEFKFDTISSYVTNKDERFTSILTCLQIRENQKKDEYNQ